MCCSFSFSKTSILSEYKPLFFRMEDEQKEVEKRSDERNNSRVNLINSLVKDCGDGYCTIRMYMGHARMRIVECPYGGNCYGDGWCENRGKVYNSCASIRTLMQFKEIEKMRYLLCKNGNTKKSWGETAFGWVESEAAEKFRNAFDNEGKRDISDLEKSCVHSVLH
jgi:hypothetical protein